ncbi:MAG TPA: SAM-dependent methyltransferase [Candidatus Scalindua sp.]|nr:SAM-dependent methyltransferase [Candidatus Scalindua sp.]
MIDAKKLEEVTANIGDMALKRRVKTVVEYLNIRPTDRILDCGCGDGLYLMVINNLYNCHFYGFDLDEKEVTLAKKNVADDSVKLTRGDIYHLPYQDGFFDKIILSEVLEHVLDDLRALEEVKRVLKENGLLIITVPNHNYPFLWDPANKILEFLCKRHIQKGFWAGIWRQHLRLYTFSKITQLAKKASFKVEESRALTHYCFPFNHVLLYGLKQILSKSLLSAQMSHTADKFSWQKKSQSKLIKTGYYILNKFDGLNDGISNRRSSVAIALKVVKKR